MSTIEETLERLQKELAEAKIGADRYEVVRKLNPSKFHDVWTININTGKSFDDIIDDLKPFYLNRGANQ